MYDKLAKCPNLHNIYPKMFRRFFPFWRGWGTITAILPYLPSPTPMRHCDAQYTPPTRLNCRVESRLQFGTSSRRLPTDSVVNLETEKLTKQTPWRFGYMNFYRTFSTMFTVGKFVQTPRDCRQLRIVYTPPTQLNSTVESRRRRRCVLDISYVSSQSVDHCCCYCV